MIGFADAHIHAISPEQRYGDSEDATLLLTVTASPNEWDTLSGVTDVRIHPFYGVHPWYADEWNDKTAKRLTDIIASTKAGVGEIGLDSVRGTVGEQMPAFCGQFGIAMRYRRPVQVHCVKADAAFLTFLRDIDCVIPIVYHGFSADGFVHAYADVGVYMSVGPRLLRRSSERIRRMVSAVPPDRLLLESDAPHCPTDFTMIRFATELASRCDIPARRLIETATENARRVVDVHRSDGNDCRTGGNGKNPLRLRRRCGMRSGGRIRVGSLGKSGCGAHPCCGRRYD